MIGALFLLTGLLAGCKKDDGKDPFGEKNRTTDEVINNCYTDGFPIAKDPVTLKIMIKDYAGLTDYSDLALSKYMKEEMNVDIEWIVVPGGYEVNTQATLAYTSGDLPDIFMGMAPLGYDFHWQYMQQDYIVQLNPLIEKYGKNIIKMFKEVPEAEYQCTGPDGKVYMLPMVNYHEEDTGRFGMTPYINTTWLSNLGLSMPQTTDQLKNVLKAFKTNDPNGNQVADEIPMSFAGDIPPGLYGPFGMSCYQGLEFVDDNQKVQFAPLTENYKKALMYYRDLYKEGLLDKDLFEQSDEDVKQKANGTVSSVGVVMAYNNTSILDPQRNMDEYEVLPPMAGPDGLKTWTYQVTESIWPEWFLITSKCKYPEIAIRIADYFYSPEGTMTALYGPSGAGGWDYTSDKKGLINDDGTPEFRFKYSPGYPVPHFIGKDYIDFRAKADESKYSVSQKVAARDELVKLEKYAPVKPKYTLYKSSVNEEEIMEDQLLRTDVVTYANDSRKAFVKGERSIENEWDAYMQQMKSFEADKWVGMHDSAYQRLLEWMNS